MATPVAPKAALQSFEAFFEANYERLLRALHLVCGSREEAEDLAQDAFVRAYERWQRLSTMANPSGYVYRIALNRYRSLLRRMAVAAKRGVAGQQNDEVEAADLRDEFRRAIATLPDGQRAALVLVEWVGMTDEEAARILRVKPVTVRVRITRARQTLRPLLEATRDE